MSSFWNFPPDSKIDIVEEGQHNHIIAKALEDQFTGIDPLEPSKFVLFGKDQAIMVNLKSFPLRVVFWLYWECMRIFNSLQ